MAGRKAALFDMDRTLVRVDTASLYTRYQRDRGEANWRRGLQVAWWVLQYRLGVIDATHVASRALSWFQGVREEQLIASSGDWFKSYVVPHVCARGRDAVARHRAAGDVVVIVTGSTPYAALPLARELGIEHVVCTRLEVDAQGCLTGGYVHPMCYGSGKIDLALRVAEQEGFNLEESTFYSDSITDLPLLERVAHPVAVNPDARLRRIAQRRGWPIELW